MKSIESPSLFPYSPVGACFDSQIHPNDRRKILRSLDIYERKKKPHSEFLKEQAEAGGVLGGPLRYKDAIIFWIRSDQKSES